MLLVQLFELDSAIMIFVFGTWFTLPWAYDSRVKRNIARNIKTLESRPNSVPTEEELQGANLPNSWLSHARRAFFFSGLFLFWSLFALVGYDANLPPFIYGIYALIAIGVSLFFFGAYHTYHVIEFASDPNYHPRI